jgi:hypothetical protein
MRLLKLPTSFASETDEIEFVDNEEDTAIWMVKIASLLPKSQNPAQYLDS